MKNKAVTIAFILLLICSAALFFAPADTESFKAENRARSEMPKFSRESFLSGNFAKDFESYVDDSIAYRSKFTGASQFLNARSGITPPEGRVVYTDKDIGTQTVKKACLLIADGKMMEVFMKDAEAEKKYAEAINKIADNIDEDVNIYSMLVPTQLEFADSIYKNIQSNQKRTIDEIYAMLAPRVKSVDAYSALENHTDEYIYFKTDHHWTMLGAYYGYTAFMRARGEAAASLSNFKKHDEGSFLGYLYEKYPDEEISPDTLEWYDTAQNTALTLNMRGIRSDGSVHKYTAPLFDKEKNNYDFFLSSDHPYAEIKNSKVVNNKTLLIIRDSFASDFVPWCVHNYSKIIMVDPRSFNENLRDILKSNKIDDMLFLNYIFTTSFEDYCDLMLRMFD